MQYEDILKADPSSFHEAAQQISQFAARVRDHAVDFSTRARMPLADTGPGGIWDGEWTGPAGMAAGDLQLAMNKAADQLESVEPILSGHADSLNRWQQQLLQIKHDAAGAGAEIHSDGTVEMKPDAAQHHGGDTAREIVKAIAADISKVLQEATDGDHSAASALKGHFSDATLNAHSVGDAWRDKHDSAETAKLMADMERSPGGVGTAAQRKQLAHLLAEHKNDKRFAKELLHDVGGKGAVKAMAMFGHMGYNANSQKTGGHGDPYPGLDGMRSNFGKILANGSGSVGGQWMSDFRDAAKEKYDIGDGPGGYKPYGYQLMSQELHSGGKFSTNFLDGVGHDLYDMDRKHLFEHNVPPESPQYRGLELDNHGGSGGFDPVNSYCDALSHNKEAATNFFSDDTTGQPDPKKIDYMLDRGGWADKIGGGVGTDSSDHSQAHTLGAIGAATDGAKPNSPGGHIFNETMKHVGSTHAHAHDHAVGLRDDAARGAMSHVLTGQLHSVNSVFSDSPPSSLGGEAARQNYSHVLQDLGRSPEAYAHFSNSETAYSALAMNDAAVHHPGQMPEVGKHYANVLSNLDAGRSDAIKAHHQLSEQEYNQRVDAVGGIAGDAASKVVGMVPIAGGTASNITSGVIDNMVQQAHHHESPQSQAEVADLHDRSRRQLESMTEQTIWQHHQHFVHTPPPAACLDSHGHPIAISDMSDSQKAKYDEWKDTSAYGNHAGKAIGDVRSTYSQAWAEAKQDSEGGY